MQALKTMQGYYDNGNFTFEKPIPVKKARIIMLWQEEETEKPAMSDEEVMRLFQKFTGSISREIDYEKERDEYLYEKYGPY